MAKYYDKIGFATIKDAGNSVWVDDINEYHYKGDILSLTSRWQGANQVNDDLYVNSRISILADPFAIDNMSKIKYVWYCGERWRVQSVDLQLPRLIINIGGVYNA